MTTNTRLSKAINDKNIKVLSHSIENNSLHFEILGSNKNAYNVTIGDEYKCTCKDFEIRNAMCKHIMHIYIKIFRIIPDIPVQKNTKITRIQKEMIINANNLFWKGHKSRVSRSTEEDDCIICIEKLKNLADMYVCINCLNGFHKNCIKALCEYNSNAKCPLCRFIIDINIDVNASIKEDSIFGVSV
jgi:hypothetical protein